MRDKKYYAGILFDIVSNSSDKEKALEAIANVMADVKLDALKEVDVQAYTGNPFVVYDILDEFSGTVFLTYLNEDDAQRDLKILQDKHETIKKLILNDPQKSVHHFIQSIAIKRLIVQKRTVENCDLSLDYNPGEIKEILKNPANEKTWIIWLSNQIGFDKVKYDNAHIESEHFYGYAPTNQAISEENIGVTIRETIEPMLEAINNAPVSPMGESKKAITVDETFNVIEQIIGGYNKPLSEFAEKDDWLN